MHYLEMNDDPRTPEQKLSAQFVYLNRRTEITVSLAKRKLCVPSVDKTPSAGVDGRGHVYLKE